MKRTAGRPKKYTDDFYIQMYREHDSFSISQMSENHSVSLSTIKNWIKKGKVLLNEQNANR